VSECRQPAAHCRTRAKTANDERVRALLVSMALIWTKLAEEAEPIQRTKRGVANDDTAGQTQVPRPIVRSASAISSARCSLPSCNTRPTFCSATCGCVPIWRSCRMFRMLLRAFVITLGLIGPAMAQERILISCDWGKVTAELVDNNATRLLVQMLPL